LASARAVTLRRAEPSPRRTLSEHRRLAVEQLSRDCGYGACAALPHHPHDPCSVREGPREGTPRIRAIRKRGFARPFELTLLDMAGGLTPRRGPKGPPSRGDVSETDMSGGLTPSRSADAVSNRGASGEQAQQQRGREADDVQVVAF